MEEKDIEVFLDDRTVVTNRLLVDLLLCLRHHKIQDWVPNITLDQVVKIASDWNAREAKINFELSELLISLLGEDVRDDLVCTRLDQLNKSQTSEEVKWGYR